MSGAPRSAAPPGTPVVLSSGDTAGEATERALLDAVAPSIRRLLDGFAKADASTSCAVSANHAFHASSTCETVEHQRALTARDGVVEASLRWRDGDLRVDVQIDHDEDAGLGPEGPTPGPALRLARLLDALLGPDAPAPIPDVPDATLARWKLDAWERVDAHVADGHAVDPRSVVIVGGDLPFRKGATGVATMGATPPMVDLPGVADGLARVRATRLGPQTIHVTIDIARVIVPWPDAMTRLRDEPALRAAAGRRDAS